MEKFERKSSDNQESARSKLEEEFTRLESIVELLREMGFKVRDRSITEENLQDEMPFPIVSDGVDGIRAIYSKQQGLKIFFTNDFEDPENSRRQEVEKRLKEAGLI